MEKSNPKYNAYVQILKEELLPAMGFPHVQPERHQLSIVFELMSWYSIKTSFLYCFLYVANLLAQLFFPAL